VILQGSLLRFENTPDTVANLRWNGRRINEFKVYLTNFLNSLCICASVWWWRI